MSSDFSLGQLGWRAHFSQQLSIDDLDRFVPARIAGVHRSGVTLWSQRGETHVLAGTLHGLTLTVGDWVLANRELNRIERPLERTSFLARMAAGGQQRVQPIAANLDLLFVVTSCNEDFNASRLERYLAIAHEARVPAAVVLTKRDLCTDIDALLTELQRIAPLTPVIPVNATCRESANALLPLLTSGSTVAFVGSSGVGKSTLVNALAGAEQLTANIREDDAKGRHTTTARQLVAMPGGAWLIDTPGMRELKVGNVEHGIRTTFDDIEQLAQRCRFRDCRHEAEVGCAVVAAISAGEISQRRLVNYRKLQREAKHALQSVFERRVEERRFGKMHKVLQEQHRRERGKR